MNLEKEKRRQSRLERLGTDTPYCGVCGVTDDRCLELHHVAGRKFDGDTVILCRNHHRMLSDDQVDYPDPIDEVPSLMEAVAHLLRGIADLLTLLAEQCRRFADKIFETLSPSAASEVQP